MSWMDVLKYLVLLIGVWIVIGVSIAMYNDGKITVAWINAWRRFPSEADKNPDKYRATSDI